MKALIVNKYMTVKSKDFNKIWETFETTNGWAFFLEAKNDLDNAGIDYIIGEVKIKQEDQEI